MSKRQYLNPVAAPALLQRELAHQPIRERARRGHPDALAPQIGDASHGCINRQDQRQVGGRPIHGRNADGRRPLRAETQCRARAEPDIETVGRKRLLHLRIPAKARDLNLETFLLENLGLDPDFGCPEGKGIGNSLTQPDLVQRERRAAPQHDDDREEG